MSILKKSTLGVTLLVATAVLGGCYYGPAHGPRYAYAPGYAYGPAYYRAPAYGYAPYGGVAVNGGYSRRW